MDEFDPFAAARPGDDDAELYITRRAGGPDDASEPLATLANRYLDRRREFRADDDEHTDQQTEEFNEAQAELLDQLEDTPAVLLDDIIVKLEVISAEILERVGGADEQLDPADRLVFTLADDIRRVLGATTAYRFDARLWVESAIRAGMNPIAIIYLDPELNGARWQKSRRLCFTVAGVNPRYEPPRLSAKEQADVIHELVRLGRADYYAPSGDAR